MNSSRGARNPRAKNIIKRQVVTELATFEDLEVKIQNEQHILNPIMTVGCASFVSELDLLEMDFSKIADAPAALPNTMTGLL